jgi:hypothetical protein
MSPTKASLEIFYKDSLGHVEKNVFDWLDERLG